MKIFLALLVSIFFIQPANSAKRTKEAVIINSSSINGAGYDFTVSKDGTGDFKTLQEAINAIPDYRRQVTSVFIKNGTYKEKIVLPESKQNIVFTGQDSAAVIITYDDYASKLNSQGEAMGTSGSAGFYIYGINITFKHITFLNSAGPVGQAVAVLVAGDRIEFIGCRFLGNQDTLYTYGKKSRQYYLNCYIEGTVDFIFGASTALFDRCTIYGKGKGYYTAASTPEGQDFGYIFRHCQITGSGEPGGYKLGRPWRPYAKTVYLYCQMDRLVAPAGWDNWRKEANEKTVYYGEYKNLGPGSALDKRVSWSKQLSSVEAATYTIENIFGDWTPGSN